MSDQLKEYTSIRRNMKQALINLGLRPDFNVFDAIEEASEIAESNFGYPNAAVLPAWFVKMLNNPKM